LPRIPGAELAIHYWPANDELDVSGDLYDVFAIDEHRFALVVGDVCGKGVAAAAITAAARHSLRAAALHRRDPASVLHWVHDAIAAQPSPTFCTVAYAVLDLSGTPVLEVALGGHDRAIVVAADGTTRDVGIPGTLLGLIEPDIHVDETKLAPGDLVALFTDGITDAPVGEVMDRAELAALLASRRDEPLDDIGEAVRTALDARRPHGSRDDAALLLLRLG
jgi:serine phosphatase RsbU (regulator of sigma subunit)